MALSPTGTASLLTDIGLGSPKLDPTNTNLKNSGLTPQQAAALNKAYTTLPGVTGNTPAIQTAAANAVYQPLDGYTVGSSVQGDGRPSEVLGTYPSGYLDSNGSLVSPNNLSPSVFNSWSSQFQKQYIYDVARRRWNFDNLNISLPSLLQYGAALTIGANTGTPQHIVITPATDSADNPLETPAKVIVVEQLTKTSFAAMDSVTQGLVVGSPGFAAVATALNLSTSTSDISNKLQTLAANMQQAAQAVGVDLTISLDSSGFPTGSSFTGSGYPANGNRFQDGRLFNYNDASIFINEVVNLANQLKAMKVYSPNDIQTKLDAIFTRYRTAVAFGNVPNQVSAADLKQTSQQNFGTGIHDGNGNFNNTMTQTRNVVSLDVASVNSPNYTVYYRVTGNNNGDNTPKIDQLSGATGVVVQVDPNNPDSMFNVNNTDGNVSTPGGPPYPKLGLKADGIKNDMNVGFLGHNIQGALVTVMAKPVAAIVSSSVAPGQTNQSTIQTGYNKLIQAEQQTLALQNQMTTITTSGALKDKSLDVPSLIFFLQLYTNLIDEQQNTAATELVNQQNNLLNTYSQMQALVNTVQGKFDSSKQTQQLDIFGNGYKSEVGGLNLTSVYWNNLLTGGTQTIDKSPPVQTAPNGQATLDLLSMFDKADGAYAKNPIEQIFNISRPTMAFVDNGQGGSQLTIAYTATAFNSFGTSLSSAVTQINQQTQIMMNNINTLDKEKNQHFDLANNCLSKLNDILSAIGRNVM